MRLIKHLVIHCTAGSQKETIKDLIQGFRMRGWKNNGYHFVIDAEGKVHNITTVEQIANGVAGHNANSIHISYMGGIDKNGKPVDNRTPAQIKAMAELLIELKHKYPFVSILGHRDFSPDLDGDGKIEYFEFIKYCPCFDAKTEYAHL